MKTTMIRMMTTIGAGAVLASIAIASPALADGRRDDNCGRPEVQVRCNDRDRYAGRDNYRRDRDDHRDGRFDQRGDRR